MTTAEVVHGRCPEALARFPDCFFDAVITDPPYDLTSGGAGGFMGKKWDATGVAFDPETWRAVLRVLKPGGHLLVFGATRTYHRMACAVEDAGFEIRDSLHWIYGTGFAKSMDVAKAVDRHLGATREVIAVREAKVGFDPQGLGGGGWSAGMVRVTRPATAEAARWEGWGTALKPSHETIVCGRKMGADPGHEPVLLARRALEGTVAGNVLKYGTGGLNVDGCRVEGVKDVPASPRRAAQGPAFGDLSRDPGTGSGWDPLAGRWPPNILFTHHPGCQPEDCAGGCPVAELDRQSGVLTSGKNPVKMVSGGDREGNRGAAYGTESRPAGTPMIFYGDTGGASRFYPCFRYAPKAPSRERPRTEDGVMHPTVKPVALMRWLVRLVVPPGGRVLDPFAGTGTTGQACQQEGVSYVLIEALEEYVRLIRSRLAQPSLFEEWA